MRRGEVWWAKFEPPAGPRPVVILTRDRGVAVRSAVTVAVVTTRFRGLPSEVSLTKADGMAKDCVINADVLHTIEKSRLERRLAVLNPGKLAALERALLFALGLD